MDHQNYGQFIDLNLNNDFRSLATFPSQPQLSPSLTPSKRWSHSSMHMLLSSFLDSQSVPVVLGVAMASLTELSFNWLGFISAMNCVFSFTYCSCLFQEIHDMDSTNVYTYISIIALIVCIPPAIIIEGTQLLKHGFSDAIAKVECLNSDLISYLEGFMFLGANANKLFMFLGAQQDAEFLITARDKEEELGVLR
ncbi:hypothetical protein Bca4012_036464 [Brassica carinata]|uniref:Sugar phosphate transporter domain-containing protein n=1 Tax=Brassica carinata TaxID=52824 RepID=A0A8X7R403_BRACI|nr:hypothetical protein Bca52824_053513 [Brassica carinata]